MKMSRTERSVLRRGIVLLTPLLFVAAFVSVSAAERVLDPGYVYQLPLTGDERYSNPPLAVHNESQIHAETTNGTCSFWVKWVFSVSTGTISSQKIDMTVALDTVDPYVSTQGFYHPVGWGGHFHESKAEIRTEFKVQDITGATAVTIAHAAYSKIKSGSSNSVVSGSADHNLSCLVERGRKYLCVYTMSKLRAWPDSCQAGETAGARARLVVSGPLTITIGPDTTAIMQRITALENTVDSLEAKADALEAKADAIGATVNSLGGKMDAVVAKVDAMATTVISLVAKTDALEAKNDVLEAKADAIGATVNTLGGKMDAVAAKVDALEAKADLLEAKSDAMEAKMDRLQAFVVEMWEREIERHLYDHANLVSLYLPEARGGRLESVRDIVQERIASSEAAGLDVKQARKFFDAGVAFLADNAYKAAFEEFSKAYRMLAQSERGTSAGSSRGNAEPAER